MQIAKTGPAGSLNRAYSHLFMKKIRSAWRRLNEFALSHWINILLISLILTSADAFLIQWGHRRLALLLLVPGLLLPSLVVNAFLSRISARMMKDMLGVDPENIPAIQNRLQTHRRLDEDNPVVRVYLIRLSQYRFLNSFWALLPSGLCLAVGTGYLLRFFLNGITAGLFGIVPLSVGLAALAGVLVFRKRDRDKLESSRTRLLELGCIHPEVKRPLDE